MTTMLIATAVKVYSNTAPQLMPAMRASFFLFLSNSSLSLKRRLGVDFVFPLSQEQEQELPHQNLNEGEVLEV